MFTIVASNAVTSCATAMTASASHRLSNGCGALVSRLVAGHFVHILYFRSGRGEVRDGAGDGADVGGLPWPTAGDEHDVVHAECVQGAAAVEQVLGGLVR
jgi:hypothetical protein